MNRIDKLQEVIKRSWEEFHKLKETLADIEHQQWANWQAYIFSKSKQTDDGYIIPKELCSRWQRQINTPYKELSEKEKDSDRREVNRYLHLLEDFIKQYGQNIIEAIVKTIDDMKTPYFLDKPFIHHTIDDTNFCSLCDTLENKFEQDKEDENIYKCKCSVWEYPKVNYFQRYTAWPKWIRWYDKDFAIELAKKHNNKENSMNEAYDNVIKILEEIKNTR